MLRMARLGVPLLVVLFVVFALVGCSSSPARNYSLLPQATLVSQAAGIRTVTVTASATAASTPNLAIANVAIVTSGATVSAAVQANASAFSNVVTNVRNAGVANTDIQTTSLTVTSQSSTAVQISPAVPSVTPTPQAVPTVQPGASAQAGGPIVATTIVQVLIRDMTQVSTVIDSAVSAGASQVTSLVFTVQNLASLEQTARTQALQSAQSQAQALAGSVSATLGSIVAITETVGGASQVAGGAATVATPAAPGQAQTQVQAQVTVTEVVTFALQ